MPQSNRFYRLFILLISAVLIFSLTGAARPALAQGVTITPTASVTYTPWPTSTPLPTYTPTITLTPTPTQTSTPAVQADADPQAWVDASTALDAFPAKAALTIQFNTPMLSGSSPNPVLVWPGLQGSVRWNDAKTTLTFIPDAPLDSQKTYTFFLDPALQSAAGKTLKDAPEWLVHVKDAPRVFYTSPSAGGVTRRDPPISVTFDQDMDTTTGQSALTITPTLPFEMEWENAQNLKVTLKAPLENNTRYDLTLSGLRTADGSLLDDYRWFYNGPSLSAAIENGDSKVIKLKFSQPLDKEKSGLPFAISPTLDGNWEWISSDTATFTATEPISSAKDYTLAFTGPLTDKDGFKTSTLAPLIFSGISPVVVLDMGWDIYSHTAYVKPDRQVFTIQFNQLVDHASAEKAFSFTPAAPGQLTWETPKDATNEALIYTLDGLLPPGKVYTLQIDKTIKDRQGQALLGHAYQQVFNSGDYYSSLSVSFGEDGENVQVVDANGSRKLQIQGTDPDINFSAYRFDLIDFAKLYADHYRSRRSAGIRDIPIPADLKSSAHWTEVSERKAGDNERYKIYETTLPTELAPGLYILDLRVKNKLYDQLFLVVTRNTLVVKNDGQNLFVWLTNINGENVPDAEVRVYSKTGEKIREGKTDADGQYRVPILPGAEPMLVSAHAAREKDQPDDVTITGFDSWYTSINDYDYSYYYRYYGLPSGQPYMVYIYTERPIYRPGQQVNFKALVRIDHDMRYEVPPVNTLVKVSILDDRNNQIESFDLHTNRFGTINGAFTLTEGAMLGSYTIETEVDGVTTNEYFKVQDYRKPDYQIKITSLQPEKKDAFVRGEEMKVQVNASYYFGEPLANTRLHINFYGSSTLPDGIVGEAVTDGQGNATITFEAPFEENDGYSYYYYYDSDYGQQIRMEVSAEDGSNQLVSSIYTFRVFSAAEKLSIDTDGYYASPNKPVKITARAVDLLDQPMPGRELTLTLRHWDWEAYDYEKADKTFQLKTDAQGNATQEVTLKSGYYDLILQGKDDNKNETKTTHWLYVFKNGNDWFSRSKENRITISADKDSYKPYEKARFAIESSFSGPALLSFERGSVINTKMIQLTAPLTIVETDVIPEHAPNVYAIVNAWQAASNQLEGGYYGFSSIPDSHLRMARTEIKVDASAKALNISITPEKKTYAPGEKVTAILQVNDGDGKPTPAELSLAVVDEAIFALADDSSANIFDAFYGERRHTVDTYNSMSPTRYLTPMLGGGGGDGGPAAAPRSDFPDTSAWLPVIETDAKGQATVSFDLPDNTTSWRLTVKAITLNHKVGQAQTNIETKKDVFVNPSLPRVLTSGDTATLTTRVHNYGAAAQTVTVNLSAAGLDLQGPGDQQITLQPGDVQTVGWRVTVSGAKPTDVTISVTGTDGPLDAVRLPLLIQPAAVKDVQNQSGQFTGDLTLALPLPRVERETSLVRLTLNRSMSGTILNGLEYLTGYPYGCVEQTMSRALPNAVVGRAASQLGVGGPALQAKVAPYIKVSIDKLYGLQHYDGGWGWWADDRSDAYETAWVLYGLGLMDQSGYPIDTAVMDNAAKWLKDNMRDMDIRTKAYAFYSMAEAGRGDKDATIQLATDSTQALDPFSQAALALALDKLGEKEQAQAIMKLLTGSAMQKSDQVYWPQPSYDGEYHQKTMASTIRTTALVLLAYTRIEPKSALIPGIVTYLAGQRQGLRGWGSTNETSFTILALTEYFKAQQAEAGSTPYEVSANGKSLFQGTLEIGNPIAALDIPMSELKDGLNSLLVTTQGGHALFYDLSTDYDLLQTNPAAAGKIKVKRSYLDSETNHPLTELKAGQLVRVVLDVDVPETASFVAVEDHLPGGLEALNEGLSAVNVGAFYDPYGYGYYEDYTHYYWEDYGYNYKEIRGDRVVFFITTFGKGSRSFSYFARATTPGEFTILPTQVYAMYDQSMWGRADSGNILIK